MNRLHTTLYIGVGNPLRKDDGVGVFVINALRAKMPEGTSCDFVESSGEGSRLMDSWRGYAKVVIFDALMKQGQPGRVVQLDGIHQAMPSDYFKYSSHAFSLAEAVEMAKVLDCLPESLTVYGIEGDDFGFGEGLSEKVSASANELLETFL